MIHRWGVCFFFQAEDGIRDLVRSRGLGDVYKRQLVAFLQAMLLRRRVELDVAKEGQNIGGVQRCSDSLSLIHI